jgi:hypothetical protein
MARKPTPKESAMRVLWLMVSRFKTRENGIAHQGQFLTTFPDGQFRSEDFMPGADYAIKQRMGRARADGSFASPSADAGGV